MVFGATACMVWNPPRRVTVSWLQLNKNASLNTKQYLLFFWKHFLPVALRQQGTSDLSSMVSFHIIHDLPPASICICVSFSMPLLAPCPSHLLISFFFPLLLSLWFHFLKSFAHPLLPHSTLTGGGWAAVVSAIMLQSKRGTKDSLTHELQTHARTHAHTHTHTHRYMSKTNFLTQADDKNNSSWWAPALTSPNLGTTLNFWQEMTIIHSNIVRGQGGSQNIDSEMTATVKVLHDESEIGERRIKRKKRQRWKVKKREREREKERERHDSFEVDRLHGRIQAVHRSPQDACGESEETAFGNTNTPWARRPLAWSRLLM